MLYRNESFRPRVKRLYVWICKIDRDIDFADLFVCGSFSDNGSESILSFCINFLMNSGKIMVASKSFLSDLYLILKSRKTAKKRKAR